MRFYNHQRHLAQTDLLYLPPVHKVYRTYSPDARREIRTGDIWVQIYVLFHSAGARPRVSARARERIYILAVQLWTSGGPVRSNYSAVCAALHQHWHLRAIGCDFTTISRTFMISYAAPDHSVPL